MYHQYWSSSIQLENVENIVYLVLEQQDYYLDMIVCFSIFSVSC